jgi:hypothetical protein
MLNSIQLQDKSHELLIEAKGEKNSTKANQLTAFAKAMLDFKHLINAGFGEMYFQKELIKAEGKLNRYLETYNEFKDFNLESAKIYASENDLHHLEFSLKCLRFLLGIKHESVL